MKRAFLLSALLLGTVTLLAGCGSRYIVVTEDYTIHVAAEKPEVDPARDAITFENEQGEEVSIPRTDVKKMQELKK